MPLVTIDVIAPKTRAWKDALLVEVRRAVCEGLEVGDERVVIRLAETPEADVDLPACRSVRLTHVRVAMYEGRSAETKASFVVLLRERLALHPGIEPSEVMVEMHEFSRTELDILPGAADLSV